MKCVVAPRCASLLAVLLALPSPSAAQEVGPARTGPVIQAFGPVWEIRTPDFPTDTDRRYRVVFDVAQGAADPAQVNARIETLARFLNMHARAGVPQDHMELALVLHGSAGKDALDDEGYRALHDVANPNRELVAELGRAGVRIILCGQTQQARGLPRDRLAPEVELALSAMTALVTLQAEGYQLIAF